MKAFTLVESLIAVSILALAIIGPLSIVDRTLVAVYTARDQLAATYLAQEGAEYIRALRDDNFLANQSGGWNNFLTAVSICDANASKKCNITSAGVLATCTHDGSVYNATSCAVNLINGVYTQAATSPLASTPYNRSIQVTAVSASEEKIVSQVRWTTHGVDYAVTVTDHLTPWQ